MSVDVSAGAHSGQAVDPFTSLHEIDADLDQAWFELRAILASGGLSHRAYSESVVALRRRIVAAYARAGLLYPPPTFW